VLIDAIRKNIAARHHYAEIDRERVAFVMARGSTTVRTISRSPALRAEWTIDDFEP